MVTNNIELGFVYWQDEYDTITCNASTLCQAIVFTSTKSWCFLSGFFFAIVQVWDHQMSDVPWFYLHRFGTNERGDPTRFTRTYLKGWDWLSRVMSPGYTFYLGGGDIPWLYLKGVVMSLGYTYWGGISPGYTYWGTGMSPGYTYWGRGDVPWLYLLREGVLLGYTYLLGHIVETGTLCRRSDLKNRIQC